MQEGTSPKELDQQQELFTKIARRYDLVNHLMTGWQDRRWRRITVKRLQLSPGSLLLDIGSGNGQLVEEATRQYPESRIIAADLTQAMMVIGRERTSHCQPGWTGADTAQLPFPGDTFDGVTSGFLVRNLKDVHRGLSEMYRVLKPGGRIAVLDTTRPPRHMLTPLIQFYMNRVIPALGKLLSGHRDAYCYLNDSTQGFLRAEELAAYLAAVGFKKVAYQQLTLGMINVHWGEK